MLTDLRKLRVKLQNLVVRAVVDLPGVLYQVRHMGSRVASGVQHLEPQGVHFRAPSGAQGVLVAPAGETAAAVLLNAQGTLPSAELAPGEGGLHYLGTYAVFLDDAGLVHLGGGTAAAAFAGRADKITTQLTALKTAISNTVVVANDGGASFKSTLLAGLASWPGDVAATKVKVT